MASCLLPARFFWSLRSRWLESARMAARIVDVAIGIVTRGGKVLICRRRQTGHLAGYWEFPGGKCEPGEAPAACVLRELAEEVGVRATVLRALAEIEHEYPQVHVRLHPFICRLEAGEPQPLECDELVWAEAERLGEFRFPEANGGLVAEIIAIMGADISP